MSTIDEKIERFTNNAEFERRHDNLYGCLEFRELAELLKELKHYREAVQEIKQIDTRDYADDGNLDIKRGAEWFKEDALKILYTNIAESEKDHES